MDRGLAIGLATTVLGIVLLLATPVAGAGPLPDPSLPVAVPSLPLPSLPPPPTLPPLPTPTLPLPTPTLPLPTPTLPLPTPTLPLPTPTLPLPTPTPTLGLPTPSVSAVPSSGGLGAGASASASTNPPGPGPAGGPVAPTDSSSGRDESVLGGLGSFLGGLVLPGLLIGVPATIVLLIVASQVAAGAAWLPIIRRWLNRRI